MKFQRFALLTFLPLHKYAIESVLQALLLSVRVVELTETVRIWERRGIIAGERVEVFLDYLLVLVDQVVE